MSDTMLSRSGRTGPFGKNDRRLDLLVSEELENAIITMATLQGVPKSEFARSLLERVLFGEFPMVRRMAARGSFSNGMNPGSSAPDHEGA